MTELLFKTKLGFQTLKFLPWHHSISLSRKLLSHRKHLPKSCSLQYKSYEMLATDVKKRAGGLSMVKQVCDMLVDTLILNFQWYSYSQLSTLLFLPRESYTLPITVWCSVFCDRDRHPLLRRLWAWHVTFFGQWNVSVQAELQDALEVSASFLALTSVMRIACSRPCLFFQPSPGMSRRVD